MKNKSYSYPKLSWWQFIQKRRWRIALSRLSPGERIKLRSSTLELPTFTDDFVASGWIKLAPNKDTNGDNHE